MLLLLDENLPKRLKLTFDKNLQHQQNFQKYPIAVFVLNAINNTYLKLKPLTLFVNDILTKGVLLAGPTIISINSGT
ncbi:MAG TPA: hypothetical protein VK772_10695 [Puia sp.]|jgi:hypothetical protein|nr:hypothetical protein [Puia sp.]